MARPGIVESSLPGSDVEDETLDDELLDPSLGELPAEAADEDDYWESLARPQGWRPLSDYRGQPGGWKTAQKFVEDGQNFLPFVKKQLSDQTRDNQNLRNEVEGLREDFAKQAHAMRQLLDFSRRAGDAGYARAVADLKSQQRQAVAEGDTTKFDQLDEQIEQMNAARAETLGPAAAVEPAAPLPQPRPAVVGDPVVQAFIDANASWYLSDKVLNSAMIAEHNRVIEESPGMSLADQLETAKEAVMARFPKKFGLAEPAPQPQRSRVPQAPLAPTQPARARTGGKSGIDSIADPAERGQARQGYLSAKRSVPDLTEAEYLQIWADPHADVLDVIEQNKPQRNRR